MWSTQNIKTYLILFLVFSVFSSKNILIYNEETLVALSFFTFILFCFHYFGNTITESLNERSSTIQKELQNLLDLKEECLQELSQEHKKIAHLRALLQQLSGFTQAELALSSGFARTQLNNQFVTTIQSQLSFLSASRSTLQQRLQKLVADSIQALVLYRLSKQEESNTYSIDATKIKTSLSSFKNSI